MTVTPNISVKDGNLVVQGKTILTGVPDSIVLTPGSGVGLVAGAFIGATASDTKNLHVRLPSWCLRVSTIAWPAYIRLSLSTQPEMGQVYLLKIWNTNKYSGLVGVFNCQGAGWCKVEKKTRIHDVSPGTLTGSIQAGNSSDCGTGLGW